MAYNQFVDLATAIANQQAQTTDRRPFEEIAQTGMKQFADNPSISSLFGSLLNSRNDAISNTQRNILGMYDAYQQATNPIFQQYVQQAIPFGQQLLSNIGQQEQELRWLYWPQGTAYKMLDDYYTRLARQVEQRARGNQALADANARASGASRGALNAARARQWASDLDTLLKFQEGRANNMMNVYNTFSQLLGGLQDRASNIKNQFVINPYLELARRQDALAQSALENQANLEQARLQRASSGGGNDLMSLYTQGSLWDPASIAKLNQMWIYLSRQFQTQQQQTPQQQSFQQAIANIAWAWTWAGQ